MKCELCRKRMKVKPGNSDIQVDGKIIHVINMPILICPVCGARTIHEVIILRAKAYADQYGYDTETNTLNFGLCEEKEGEETVAMMQMMGLL